MDDTNGAMACGGKGKVVVVVMGATATGKSKLAVDLALRFDGEVINSDKIQIHDGLAIVTNKVTPEECRGIPHHLIGVVSPDADYTTADFCRDATRAVGSVHARGRVPIIAGGSNRYLEALLDWEPAAFRRRYECCFLWVDADLPVLDRYIRRRVDCLLEQGLVDEVRGVFRPDADYSRGIRRAIGVPEMDAYFRLEAAGELDGDDDGELRARLLSVAVDEIKANTCRLVRRQLRKIRRLHGISRWSLRRLDATAVLMLNTSVVKDPENERAAWEADVAGPATRAVATFLGRNGQTTDGKAGLVAAAAKEVAMAGAGTTEWCGRQLEKAAVALGRARVLLGLKAAAAAV